MTRKDVTYIGVIIAILLSAFLYGRNEGVKAARWKHENEMLLLQIKALQGDLDTAITKAVRESENREQIVKAANKAQGDLRQQITFWRGKVSRTAKVPESGLPVSDSVSVYPCAEMDSVIEIQDKLIISLDKELVDVSDSFTREMDLTKKQVNISEEIANAWRDNAHSSQKQVKKERFFKKVWRTVAIGCAIAVGVLAVSSQ
jgi:hypothetical protein